MNMKTPTAYLIYALIAGALLPFGFAPTGFFVLTVISPLLFLFTLEHATPKQSFWRGFSYGVGAFGCGVYWIFISMYVYGNTNIFLSSIITAGFVAILSLFPALNGYLFTKFFSRAKITQYLLVFPALWVLLEWVRSWFLTGFPWLLLGQSQTSSPLHGFAPVLGVYGVSFLVILSAALLFMIIKNKHRILSAVLLALIWLGGYGLTFVHWTKAISNPIPVTLIQANVPESMKWSSGQAIKSLQLYENLSVPHFSSPIIVWPETAVTFLLPDAVPFLESFDKFAQRKNVAVITGIPIPHDDRYYNGAIVLGDGEGHYFKRHLVPFGEYVPFESILRGLFGFLNLPMSSFTAGPSKQDLMNVRGVKVGTFICYEIAYSRLLRLDLPEANLLVTISNDTWFDRSSALAQHRQIAQFGAEMTQRYMLIDTNSGQTAIVNPEGKILAQAPIDKTTSITANVRAMEGNTPWIIFGNMPILVLVFLGLYIGWVRQKK